MTASLRPKRGRLALTLGAAALCGVVSILATARATRVERRAAAPTAVVVSEPIDSDVDAAWTIADKPLERTGYRRGRQHVIEVVPLGPDAIEVEVRTARAFIAMREAAADAGVDLDLESGFRTIEKQRELFEAWRRGQGNKAAAPGKSNHQSGRALDLVVSAPGALAWLEANAASFGFKRTVKSEPWHWEYVDVETARADVKPAKRKSPAKGKRAKLVGQAKRPARRPTSRATTARSSTRVASSSATRSR